VFGARETVAESNLEAVRECFDAFSARDADRYVAALAPDVEIRPSRPLASGAVFRGHDGARTQIAELRERYERNPVSIRAMEDCGDGRVLVEGAVAYMSRGEDGVGYMAWWIVTTRDGVVSTIHAFSNPTDARRAVGLD
jgi:ketosteroid isomerase-like protein